MKFIKGETFFHYFSSFRIYHMSLYIKFRKYSASKSSEGVRYIDNVCIIHKKQKREGRVELRELLTTLSAVIKKQRSNELQPRLVSFLCLMLDRKPQMSLLVIYIVTLDRFQRCIRLCFIFVNT